MNLITVYFCIIFNYLFGNGLLKKPYYMRFFFHKQHFYKQRQAEIGKIFSKRLSNTLMPNFW